MLTIYVHIHTHIIHTHHTHTLIQWIQLPQTPTKTILLWKKTTSSSTIALPQNTFLYDRGKYWMIIIYMISDSLSFSLLPPRLWFSPYIYISVCVCIPSFDLCGSYFVVICSLSSYMTCDRHAHDENNRFTLLAEITLQSCNVHPSPSPSHLPSCFFPFYQTFILGESGRSCRAN